MGLEAFSLKGKVALVTGAKRGIGAGIAVALAEAGAEVIGVSASLETEGSEIARRVAGVGGGGSPPTPATSPTEPPSMRFWRRFRRNIPSSTSCSTTQGRSSANRPRNIRTSSGTR